MSFARKYHMHTLYLNTQTVQILSIRFKIIYTAKIVSVSNKKKDVPPAIEKPSYIFQ